MTKEAWRPVVGLEDIYEVSDLGNVRTLWLRNKYSVQRPPAPRALKAYYSGTNNSYRTVTLYPWGGKPRRVVKISVLVLESFVGPRPGKGYDCAHRDGNPGNDSLSNLGWISHYENMIDRVRHGTMTRGSKHPNAKLTEGKVMAIRRLSARGVSDRALSKEFKVHRGTLYPVIKRKTWRHVLENGDVITAPDALLANL